MHFCFEETQLLHKPEGINFENIRTLFLLVRIIVLCSIIQHNCFREVTTTGVMTIEFFCCAPSPFSRMVSMTLKALDLKFQPKPIDFFKGEQKSEAHLARNPRGKIPVIKDGDLVVSER